jgi:hypothetical protein
MKLRPCSPSQRAAAPTIGWSARRRPRPGPRFCQTHPPTLALSPGGGEAVRTPGGAISSEGQDTDLPRLHAVEARDGPSPRRSGLESGAVDGFGHAVGETRCDAKTTLTPTLSHPMGEGVCRTRQGAYRTRQGAYRTCQGVYRTCQGVSLSRPTGEGQGEGSSPAKVLLRSAFAAFPGNHPLSPALSPLLRSAFAARHRAAPARRRRGARVTRSGRIDPHLQSDPSPHRRWL